MIINYSAISRRISEELYNEDWRLATPHDNKSVPDGEVWVIHKHSVLVKVPETEKGLATIVAVLTLVFT